MEMQVIKPGLLDSFQDTGWQGYRWAGLGSGGAMDTESACLANLLVGNLPQTAVLELHFPGPQLLFDAPVEVSLTGADFDARTPFGAVKAGRPVLLPQGSLLSFGKKILGERAYLAVKGGWQLTPVLGSCSTHFKSGFGGFKGRSLQKGDVIRLADITAAAPVENDKVYQTRWRLPAIFLPNPCTIRVLPGPEWHLLPAQQQHYMLNNAATIGQASDRMAYRLSWPKVLSNPGASLNSSGVLPGTVQLLPSGEALVLMADAQTTGGYARILQVAAADLPLLAQLGSGTALRLQQVTLGAAIRALQVRQQRLGQLAASVKLMHQYPYF
ncbi:MAG: biotin-dependent carboxyltransferase family protein [Chitinophagaceae bacterium]|nr:biotin-dependent carboxyltransferase family protein [Chitinophagaceae bacterium]